MRKDIIITVGCDYGSGGPDIGKKIAEDFGIPCYDRALIDKIIEEAGLSKAVMEMAESGSEIRGRSNELKNTKSPTKYSVLTDRVVYIQTRIIEKLADRGPCVIIGRCSDYVLRDRDNILNVFVYAPNDKRREHVMKVLHVSPEAADSLLEKNDRMLHARYKQMTGTYRGDRNNRHMLIDSSILGIEGTAKFIESVAEQMVPD